MGNFIFIEGANEIQITPSLAIDNVDSSAVFPVGTKCVYKDDDGNLGTYVYVEGVASTAQYDFVLIDSDYSIIRITKAEADKKRVKGGVAQAAIVANKYGWVQIEGKGKVKVLANCAKEVQLYTCATTGSLDDDSTSQTAVYGIVLTTDCGGSAAATDCFMSYPTTNA